MVEILCRWGEGDDGGGGERENRRERGGSTSKKVEEKTRGVVVGRLRAQNHDAGGLRHQLPLLEVPYPASPSPNRRRISHPSIIGVSLASKVLFIAVVATAPVIEPLQSYSGERLRPISYT